MRGLTRAQAEGLGNLVVISGPNGAGKSSLLDLIKSHRQTLMEPGTTLMFVGPHRTWRSSQLNRVAVYDYQLASYGAALESEQLPSYRYQLPPGMQGLAGLPRQSSSADDVQAFVKTSLIRLRDRRQQLIERAFDEQGGQVAVDTVPNLFAPFVDLIDLLLPHLEWVGVNDDNPENIRALFRPRGTSGEGFDIDELSSGEKAAIALLLPIVERQAEELITPTVLDPHLVPLTMILDEPELHLHPLLQLQMLTYMRKLASEGAVQFILTTHSPTLLDATTEGELFLLSPASLSPDNQLSQLATSEERLEVARSITGSTHVLTRAKPILFVEGEFERRGVNADSRLMSMLFAETRSWAVVPSNSKRSVIDATRRLRMDGLELPGVPVFGLVDADQDVAPEDQFVIAWQVAMIENLLLDPVAIFSALEPFGAQTRATNVDAVTATLARVIDSRFDDEVRLRIKNQLPVGRLDADPLTLDGLDDTARADAEKWVASVKRIATTELVEGARSAVEAIVANETQAERFHGKRILHAVYDALQVAEAGVGKSAFALMLAAQDATQERAARLGAKSMNSIRYYFPRELPGYLTELNETLVPDGLIARCAREVVTWTDGASTGEGRETLREEVFGVARNLDHERRSELTRLASQIGTD